MALFTQAEAWSFTDIAANTAPVNLLVGKETEFIQKFNLASQLQLSGVLSLFLQALANVLDTHALKALCVICGQAVLIFNLGFKL